MKVKNMDIKKIIAYYAIKIKANPTAPYSILNPDTSSDSPSAKSNKLANFVFFLQTVHVRWRI